MDGRTSGAVRGCGVLVHGDVVAAVGDADHLARAHADAVEWDLGDVVLLPGLVNAHCHLELTHHRAGDPPATFVDWVLRLLAVPRGDPPAAARDGLAQCVQFGVTTVGDVTTDPAALRPALAAGPTRVVSYGEVRAMAGRRHLLVPRVEAAAEHEGLPALARGVSPHAPYSIEPRGYRACLQVALALGMPLTTHLAETPHEADFLASHAGPLRDLWTAIGGWDDDVPTFAGGPIRFAQSLGLLDYARASLAHVNYCDDDELAVLASGKASVVYCPRTHAYFGHPPHRWRAMLARGINVAVGTDSCASSPDLNLVDDLRLLHRTAPDVPASVLWEMGTLRGARAMGLENEAGSIAPGKRADFVAFDVSASDDVLLDVLESDARPGEVWIGGCAGWRGKHQIPSTKSQTSTKEEKQK